MVQHRLRAVEPGQHAGELGRQPRLVVQRELGVEHDTGRASGDAGGGGVGTDTATGPGGQGQGGIREHLLEKDERAQLAGASTALRPAHDQAGRTGLGGAQRLCQAGDFGQYAPGRRTLRGARGVGEQHRVHEFGQLAVAGRTAFGYPDAERRGRPATGAVEQIDHFAGVTDGQFQHTDRAGSGGGDGQAWGRSLQGVEHDDRMRQGEIFGPSRSGSA